MKIEELRQQDLILSTYKELPNLPIEYFIEEQEYFEDPITELAPENDQDKAWSTDLEVLESGFIDLGIRADTVKLKQHEVTAVAAIALDGYVRYGYEGVDIRRYLMDMLLEDKIRVAEEYTGKTKGQGQPLT